jgi:hypothetical protein
MPEGFKKPTPTKEMEFFRKEGLSKLERVREAGNLFLKRLRQLGVVLAIGMASHYNLTHKNKIEKTIENGREIFKHNDEETTHILNYFGGVDSLSDSERFNMFKSKLKFGGEMSENLPKNFDKMNEDEVLAYFHDFYKNTGMNIEETKKLVADSIEAQFPKKYNYNDTLYRILWETEKECGAPNIRWTYGHKRNFLTPGPATEARYSFKSHTCFIQPYDSAQSYKQLNNLIAEWAHAKQFDHRYISSILESIRDMVRIANDMIENNNTFIKSHKKEYEIGGSIENEAHEILEPYIKSKFEEIKSIKLDKDEE